MRDVRHIMCSTHHVPDGGSRHLEQVNSSLAILIKCFLLSLLQGPYDFDGQWHNAVTAHPKVDPSTGHLVFFSYNLVMEASWGEGGGG